MRIDKLINRARMRQQATKKRSDHAKRILEISELMEALDRDYNSPEEKEKRRARYEEIQQIGALRKAAFQRGASMDIYPLPFGSGDANEELEALEKRLREEGNIL